MKYSDLLVWRKSLQVVTGVYRTTQGFPKEEVFGLVSQMRRAAVSVPSNIAEGHGRKKTRAFANHLSIANGSLMELETQLILSRMLGFVSEAEFDHLMQQTSEVGKMLNGLLNSLNPEN